MVEENHGETLIISYVFPPADDVSGIVQAKRILTDKKPVDILVTDEGNDLFSDFAEYLDFLNLTTKFDVLIATDLSTYDNFKINPYLPSKIADYTGSGRDIWMIYEN